MVRLQLSRAARKLAAEAGGIKPLARITITDPDDQPTTLLRLAIKPPRKL